ncbi:hypothetical protein D9M68_840740 [compost metagenome]
MVDRVGLVAHELLDLPLALRQHRGGRLGAAVAREGRLLQQPAHHLEAAHQASGVVGVLQEPRVDEGRHLWIGAGQAQAAPAPGPQQAHVT